MERKELNDSKELYLSTINGDDVSLMVLLAKFYNKGPEDLDKWFLYEECCISLLEKASEKNNIEALNLLAHKYRRGTDYMGKNIRKAISLYKKASELGSCEAMLMISDIIEYDYEEANYKESLKWIKKAVDKNYPRSFYVLGKHYEQGKGVIQSDDMAYKCYEKGAELKDDECMCELNIY